jgi:DNA-binding NtrC family response regulator
LRRTRKETPAVLGGAPTLRGKPKGANILFVHDDDHFIARAVAALQSAGNTVTTSSAVLEAIDQLDATPPPDVLVTRIRFGPGRSNGLALARMARYKHPRIKIIFTALRDFEQEAAGLGTFLAAPVSIPDLVTAVHEALADRELREASAAGQEVARSMMQSRNGLASR